MKYNKLLLLCDKPSSIYLRIYFVLSYCINLNDKSFIQSYFLYNVVFHISFFYYFVYCTDFSIDNNLGKNLYLFLIYTMSEIIYSKMYCYITGITQNNNSDPKLLIYSIFHLQYYIYLFITFTCLNQFFILLTYNCSQLFCLKLYYCHIICIKSVFLYSKLICIHFIYQGACHTLIFDKNSLNQLIILPKFLIRFSLIYIRLYYSLLNIKYQLIFSPL